MTNQCCEKCINEGKKGEWTGCTDITCDCHSSAKEKESGIGVPVGGPLHEETSIPCPKDCTNGLVHMHWAKPRPEKDICKHGVWGKGCAVCFNDDGSFNSECNTCCGPNCNKKVCCHGTMHKDFEGQEGTKIGDKTDVLTRFDAEFKRGKFWSITLCWNDDGAPLIWGSSVEDIKTRIKQFILKEIEKAKMEVHSKDGAAYDAGFAAGQKSTSGRVTSFQNGYNHGLAKVKEMVKSLKQTDERQLKDDHIYDEVLSDVLAALQTLTN